MSKASYNTALTHGRVRISCYMCDAELDGVDKVPVGWTHVDELRSYERSIEEVPLGQDVNKYGDTVHDWETHRGFCELCSLENGEYKDGEYPAGPG